MATATGFDSNICPIARNIEKAIGYAQADGLLFFAAAGNYGPIKQMAFPASLQNSVFGIFSTDARGADAGNTASYNPRPTSDYNRFAILGDNVEFLDDIGDTETMSGTSASTIIAASLAGHLLDFARQDDISTKLLRPLESFRDMSNLFQYMALSMNYRGYRCLTLEKLLRDTQHMSKQEARSRICLRIDEALSEP